MKINVEFYWEIIMNEVYKKVKEFKNKYKKTVAFRLKSHAKVVNLHLNEDEILLYAFVAQNNKSSLMIINSCVVALTSKRIIIGKKRLLWGYFMTSITPDLYNDIKIIKNLIWSDIEIDTVKENVYLSNIDPKGAIEIESTITNYMIKEKQKYGKKHL